MRIIIGIFCFVLILGSCKKQQEFDKQAMLESLVDDYVLPSYEQLLVDNKQLETACVDFIDNPTVGNLTTVQEAWKTTMRTWSTVELLNFGPGRTAYRYLQLDNTPVNATSIDNAIAGTVVIDADYIRSRSSYTKGLASIEYLLFDGNNSSTIVNQYATAMNKERRAAYLMSCIQNIKATIQIIYDEWKLTYGTKISAVVDNSTLGGIGNFSNAIIHLSQTMARKKLGKPLGKESTDQSIHLEYLESPYANANWDIILYNLKGIQQIFGTKDKGLGSYLTYLVNDAQLTNKISQQIIKIETLIKARTLILKEDLLMNKGAVEEIYQELRSLYEALDTNIGTYFSITILANPDDGD